jgi:DNA-binding response OmpR family regulator
MRVLLAEDDRATCRSLEAVLSRWDYEVFVTSDGAAAWQVLQGEDPPQLALLDWVMPGLTGLDVCRRVRARPAAKPLYLILLTARTDKEDIVTGLEAGADDYVTKPFDRGELRARLQAGRRIVELQNSLADRVGELEEALARVKQLQGLLPICCYCKKIRDDRHYWRQVECYLAEHSDARFTHSICPDCFERVARPELEQLSRRQAVAR